MIYGPKREQRVWSKKDAVFDVAIVGAGFSGSMVAVHLSRLAPETRVLLAD